MSLLLREAIGGSIRRARTARRRTLRDVSGQARVSLGYLSEIERGRKEPSSELLAAICEALAFPLPELLDDVADTMRPVPRRVPVPAGGLDVDPALASAVEAAFGPEPARDADAGGSDAGGSDATGADAAASDVTVAAPTDALTLPADADEDADADATQPGDGVRLVGLVAVPPSPQAPRVRVAA